MQCVNTLSRQITFKKVQSIFGGMERGISIIFYWLNKPQLSLLSELNVRNNETGPGVDFDYIVSAQSQTQAQLLFNKRSCLWIIP